MESLWEILVPCNYNDGTPVKTRHHRVWDDRVRAISGGLTILKPGKGQWINKSNNVLYEDRIIPVRIKCTREEIEKIAKITIQHYEQEAVMFYRVTSECIVLNATAKDRTKFFRSNQKKTK